LNFICPPFAFDIIDIKDPFAGLDLVFEEALDPVVDLMRLEKTAPRPRCGACLNRLCDDGAFCAVGLT
jgi:hypothetical protein